MNHCIMSLLKALANLHQRGMGKVEGAAPRHHVLALRLVPHLLLLGLGLAATGQASSLNEPPYYSQVLNCIDSAQAQAAAWNVDPADYERHCGFNTCTTNRSCCEHYCYNKVHYQPPYEQCVRQCSPAWT